MKMRGDEGRRRFEDAVDRPGWVTDGRVSRRDGGDWCVLEVREATSARIVDRPVQIHYHVHRHVQGQPAGPPRAILPSRRQAQAYAERPPNGKSGAGAGVPVPVEGLVAEGDPTVRRLVSEVLGRVPLGVDSAPDPAATVRLLADGSRVFRFIVLDPRWLESDGDLLRRRLRERPELGIVTCGAAPGASLRGRNPVRPIDRPFTVWSLLEAVGSLVGMREVPERRGA